MTTQNLRDALKTVLGGKFIAIKPTSRNKKILNKQTNLTSKQTIERRTKNPRVTCGGFILIFGKTNTVM